MPALVERTRVNPSDTLLPQVEEDEDCPEIELNGYGDNGRTLAIVRAPLTRMRQRTGYDFAQRGDGLSVPKCKAAKARGRFWSMSTSATAGLRDSAFYVAQRWR